MSLFDPYRAHRFHPLCRHCWVRVLINNADAIVAFMAAAGVAAIVFAARRALVN